MSDLPEGWGLVKLGNVAKWGSGGTPSRSKDEYYGGSIPWFKTGELNDQLLVDSEEHITELGVKKSSAKIFPKGSVAVAMYGATIGRTAIFGVDGSTNQACAVAQPYEIVDRHFLHFFLKSEKQNFIDKGKGGAQPNISQTIIKDHPFPLPPLNEQRRIVAKLDALFAQLDTVKARLERIPTLLKQFRQAVLTQAVTGKLTKGFGFKWKTVEVNELAAFIGSGITPKGGKSRYLDEGVCFIRSMNVYPDGLRLDNLVYVSEELHQRMKRTHVQENDVLLNITGASIGRSTFVPENFGEANVNQHVCIIRVNERVIPKYLSIYLNSEEGQKYIMSTQSGMTRQGLNYTQIRSMPIALPDIEAQQKIVSELGILFEKIGSIEHKYQQLKEKIDRLPQTILAQAFRGELVPQDPTDEPAEELLKKINSEQASKPPAKKKQPVVEPSAAKQAPANPLPKEKGEQMQLDL